MPFLVLFQARFVFLISLLVSIAALGAAFVAQFGLGLKPCILCLYSRLPFVYLMVVCLIALFRHERERKVFLILIALGFFVSLGLSLFHAGVEQHWWELSSGCPVQKLDATTSDQALAELLTTPQVSCDEVAWRILGVSVVFWNAALAFGMLGYVVIALMLFSRKKHI